MIQNLTAIAAGKFFFNPKYNKLKTLDSGTDVIDFSLSVPAGKDENGNYLNEFIKVTVFGNGAKFVANNANTIDTLYVVGTPKVEAWLDSDGQAKAKQVITTNSVSVITWKKPEDSESDAPDTTPKKSNDPFST